MLASVLRVVFVWLSGRRWLGRLAMGTPGVRNLARRFVAGTTLDEAVAVVRALNARGAMATIDVLGEAVTDRATAEAAAASYVATLERIAAEGLDANVSLKLTQMGLDLGVDTCLEVLRPVAEAGTRLGIFVRVDMESSAYTDRTLEVVRRLRAEGCDIGPVIQAYLHRSRADAAALAAEGFRVRVCKGAYAEPESIAFHDREEIRRSFLDCLVSLLEADAYPAAATHDPELIAVVQRAARERGIGPDRFEFQLLYGIGRDLVDRLLAEGHRVRIYVPYGSHWWPYFMRRLAERPANVMFFLRGLFERGGGR
ncbi:MAG TPA: proline dehydrogenase family protein [candidate division Zixibacteria bacterium]|nr:proline dehydrogenase family protein [candidate division Zixibacteria bacterium]